MNKFLILLVFVLSIFSVHAQTQSKQEETNALALKVDSLEHELSYLQLTYELNKLNTDLNLFRNDVYASAIDVKLDLFNRNYDSKLCESYQQYYESCQRKQKLISELIEAKKTFFALKVYTYPFTEDELSNLMATYNLINDAYSALQNAMDLFKVSINGYKRLLGITY